MSFSDTIEGMSPIDIHELNSIALVNRLGAGEHFLLLDKGHPVAELRPLPSAARVSRPFGLCEGEFRVPDDFDAALADEILAGFEGR